MADRQSKDSIANPCDVFTGPIRWLDTIDPRCKPGLGESNEDKDLSVPTVTPVRCKWSSTMKKDFQEAIMYLGGLNQATPKQIFDIMTAKPNHLTIFHLKSRLQKCRANARAVNLDRPADIEEPASKARRRLGQEWKVTETVQSQKSRQHQNQDVAIGPSILVKAEEVQLALAHHQYLMQTLDAQIRICQETQSQLSIHLGYVHSLLGDSDGLPTIPEVGEESPLTQEISFTSDVSNAGFAARFGGIAQQADDRL